ncbi:ATP-binding protein, partial [Campylobacter coli]|nr:ATP-binding protein [Campylobacter coli]
MQIDASKNQSFSMDYTTKSGKHLALSMYDNQSLSYSNDEEGKSLNLKRQYGFSFTFEGSKLTQADLDEIKNAMKEVEPMIKDF